MTNIQRADSLIRHTITAMCRMSSIHIRDTHPNLISLGCTRDEATAIIEALNMLGVNQTHTWSVEHDILEPYESFVFTIRTRLPMPYSSTMATTSGSMYMNKLNDLRRKLLGQ